MTLSEDIKAALVALHAPGSRKGVSRAAIKAFLHEAPPSEINHALKTIVRNGQLTQLRDSFKLAPRQPPARKVPKKGPTD